MLCQRAKVEAISACLPSLWGCHSFRSGARIEWNALDVIRVPGHNRRFRVCLDYKLGDDTKRRRGAFQCLPSARSKTRGRRKGDTHKEYVWIERSTCARNGTVCEHDLNFDNMVKR